MKANETRTAVENEIRITVAPLRPVTIERPDPRSELLRMMAEIKERNEHWEPSLWERFRWWFEGVLNITKLGISITPSLLSLSWAVHMKSTTKIATALVALALAVLAHFDIIIPEAVAGALDIIVALLIGILIPGPKTTPKGE